MRNLKKVRVLASVVFFTAALLYCILSHTSSSIFAIEEKAQIVPSRIFLPVTLGATLFWLVLTALLGRIYCSSVCPLGTLMDGAIFLRSRMRHAKKDFRYKNPSALRYHFLILYVIALVASIGIVCVLMEPWPLFSMMCGIFNHEAVPNAVAALGIGVPAGIIAGVLSFIVVVAWAAWKGRDFCNIYCPIGTALGAVSHRALYQIRFIPDRCTGCLRCEEVCKASCIKASQRMVDNARCVRCFNCLDACKDDAIKLLKSPPAAATGLMAHTE